MNLNTCIPFDSISATCSSNMITCAVENTDCVDNDGQEAGVCQCKDGYIPTTDSDGITITDCTG